MVEDWRRWRHLELMHVILSEAKDLARQTPRSFASLRMTCRTLSSCFAFAAGWVKIYKLDDSPEACEVFIQKKMYNREDWSLCLWEHSHRFKSHPKQNSLPMVYCAC